MYIGFESRNKSANGRGKQPNVGDIDTRNLPEMNKEKTSFGLPVKTFLFDMFGSCMKCLRISGEIGKLGHLSGPWLVIVIGYIFQYAN